MAGPALHDDVQPTAQMLTSTVSHGEYTAPVTINADDQQQAAAIPPQPKPEYTLPIKKELRGSSPAHSTEVSATEGDYLLPSTGRPEPVGANEVSAVEGSSLKNIRHRRDVVNSVSEAATDEYTNIIQE